MSVYIYVHIICGLIAVIWCFYRLVYYKNYPPKEWRWFDWYMFAFVFIAGTPILIYMVYLSFAEKLRQGGAS